MLLSKQLQIFLVLVSALAIVASGQRGFRSACPCRDEQPSGEFTCEQQRKFGKCSEDFMVNGGFCQATCGRCPMECPYEPPVLDLDCGCTNVAPNQDFTCDEQRQFGSCTESWMIDNDFCAASCGRCICIDGVRCSDVPPPGNILCPKQLEFGKCMEPWMAENNYCEVSCGTCPSSASLVTDDEVDIIAPANVIQASQASMETLVAPAPEPEDVPEDMDVVQEPVAIIPNTPVPARTSVVDSVVESVVETPIVESVQEVPITPPSVEVEEREEPESVEIADDRFLSVISGAFEQASSIDATPVVDATVVSVAPVPAPELETVCSKSLLEVVNSTPELSLLAATIRTAGLEALLSDTKAELTVFAPNDEAFEAFATTQDIDLQDLLNDDEQGTLLQTILGYHVLAISLTSSDLRELAIVDTLLGKDSPLFIEVQRRRVTLEGIGSSATVINPDIKVCNSMVHIIDEVLLTESDVSEIIPVDLLAQLTSTAVEAPKDEKRDCVQASAVDILSNIPEANSFVTALEATEFESFPDSPFTVFVPTQEAFQTGLLALGFDGLADAVSTEASRQLLVSVLNFHIVAGFTTSEELAEAGPLVTLNGSTLMPELSGRVLEIQGVGNTATVVEEDASDACDVAVHVVDAILLPFVVGAGITEVDDTARVKAAVQSATANEEGCDSLGDVIASYPELQLLATSASLAGLDTVFSDPTQQITLFAPTNAAFQGLTDILGENSAEVISNADYLNTVLAYHALDGVFMAEDLTPGRKLPTLVQNRRGNPVRIAVGDSKRSVVIVGKGSNATILEEDIPACGSVIHIVDTVLLPVSQA